jgi:hypothetical protein
MNLLFSGSKEQWYGLIADKYNRKYQYVLPSGRHFCVKLQQRPNGGQGSSIKWGGNLKSDNMLKTFQQLKTTIYFIFSIISKKLV